MMLPAGKYAAYLLSRGRTPREVCRDLVELGLTQPGVDLEIIVDGIHADLGDPPPELGQSRPGDVRVVTSAGVRRWLQHHGIVSIWIKPGVADGIDAILARPRLREAVEYAHLAGYSPAETVELLAGARLGDVTAGQLRGYLYYCFNLGGLTNAQVLEMLDVVPRALWSRRGGTESREFLLHLLGLAPIDATVEAAGRQVIRLAHERLFLISAGRPSKEDAMVVQRYAQALKHGADIVGQGDEALRAIQEVMSKITVGSTGADDIEVYDELGVEVNQEKGVQDGHGGTS